MTTCLRDSVSLHSANPKGWRSSEFEDRVAQVIKSVTGGVTKGEATGELNMMPATTSPSPIALRPTSRIRGPAKTRPPSTASQSSPTTSSPSSTTFQPLSMVLLSPSTVSRSSSTTHWTPNSTANSYQGPSIPLPPPISLPQLFANPIPQPSTRCTLKEQCVCQFIPPTPSPR